MMHECSVGMYQCPSDLVVDGMDGRTRYLLQYSMVWYGTVLPLGGEGMLVCRYVCVHVCWAGLGGAVLGGAGAVRCWAVRCWLHCRSLMKKKKMKVKDKKRKKEKNMLHAVARLGELFGQGREYAEVNCSLQ